MLALVEREDMGCVEVLQRLMNILDPPPPPPEPETPKRRIGFHVEPEEKPVAKARKKP